MSFVVVLTLYAADVAFVSYAVRVVSSCRCRKESRWVSMDRCPNGERTSPKIRPLVRDSKKKKNRVDPLFPFFEASSLALTAKRAFQTHITAPVPHFLGVTVGHDDSHQGR